MAGGVADLSLHGLDNAMAWLVALPWVPGGECFRCEASGVLVTRYGDMTGSRGTVILHSCQPCTSRMECRYRDSLAGVHRAAGPAREAGTSFRR